MAKPINAISPNATAKVTDMMRATGRTSPRRGFGTSGVGVHAGGGTLTGG